jgi:hypothetical protein
MPLYTLHISGSWPVTIEDADNIPTTPEALQSLYEDLEINPYDLDDLTLKIEPATPAMRAKYDV